MATTLQILTQLSLLLLVGMAASGIARKVKMSNVLLLLLLGLLIGKLTTFFDISNELAEALGIITLAIVVFEGTSRISYRQLSTFSGPALEVTGWQVLFATILLGGGAYLMFFQSTPSGLILSAVLAVTLSGTDPSSVLIMLKESTGHLTNFLRLEAIINTPLIVLLPFILLDAAGDGTFAASQLVGVVQQIAVGLGAGLMIGLIVFKLLKRFYSQDISTVVVIAAALLSYITAENLQGSGVLAVATLGIMFGNFNIKKKESLQDFSSAFYNILELIIFPLIGVQVGVFMPFTASFLLKSFFLFLLLLTARFIALLLVYKPKDLTLRERIFCTITMPKGIAVSVLIFTFALNPLIPHIMLSVLFTVAIYSILTATFSSWWWNHANRQYAEGKHDTKHTA